MVVDFSIAFGLSRSSTKLFISFERPAAPSPGATQSSSVVTWWTVSPAIFICCGKLLQTPSSTMAFPSEWFGGRGTVSPPTSEVPSRGVVGGGGGRAYENGRGGYIILHRVHENSLFLLVDPLQQLSNTKMSKMNHNSLEWTNPSLTIETCTLLCDNKNTMLNVMLLDFQTWQLKWGGKRKSEWWTNR